MRVSTKLTLQTAATLAILAAALFLPAGTLRIPEFWLYLAINAAVMAGSLLWLPPDLLQERARPGGKPMGPAYIPVALVPFMHWIAAGLDRRFHWTDTVPLWLQFIGFGLVIGGFALFFWGMLVNRFFSSVSRIQSERGQYVVTDGPYRYVRHPGYTGAIALVLGSGLALGSWLSVLVFLPALGMLLYRTLKEDALLQAELPGYREYAARVRWRWLPGIW
jgi:protein-S-isoprenylcysteine O-methyltransferase Ste14